jgi:hypothetical protein
VHFFHSTLHNFPVSWKIWLWFTIFLMVLLHSIKTGKISSTSTVTNRVSWSLMWSPKLMLCPGWLVQIVKMNVLVVFLNSDVNQAACLSCVFEQFQKFVYK